MTSLPPSPIDYNELSLAYSSLSAKTGDSKPGTSGIVRDPNPEKKRDLPDESQANAMNDLAENTLLALVRTGIGNDFEEVVFPQYPSLRITKRQLMGSDSDGSGSRLRFMRRYQVPALLCLDFTGPKQMQRRLNSASSPLACRLS